MANYIRFDWAMKRLLRNKANFGVLEGLLTTLLDEKITISQLLESESNQEDEFDKYNRVDLLALDSKGELILIEVQNNNEYAYFQRMLFGVSKLVTEYINRGEGYENVRKVYSVNIVYFSLGHGKDIVYHGKTEFRGIHENDILELTPFQRQTFKVDAVSQLYPEYYILKVNDFNKGIAIDGSAFEANETPFSYGMACYPEKHEEAPNMDSDIFYLKEKVKNGADYLVTQMFFDNEKYYAFVDRCRAEGITVPIIPGIKPIVFKNQLTVLPKIFRSDIPEPFATELRKCKTDDEAKAVGVEWCIQQCKDLIAHGVPSLHFYTMMASDSVYKVAKEVY